MTLSNIISFFRLILIAPSIHFILNEMYCLSFLVISLAGFSDILDGFLARLMKRQSRIGMYLDPFADKCFLSSLFIGLNFQKEVPDLFVILVLTRDFLIITGTVLLLSLDKKSSFFPNWFGKATTFLQILTAIFITGQLSLEMVIFKVNNILILTTSVAIGVSFLIYMKIGIIYLIKKRRF